MPSAFFRPSSSLEATFTRPVSSTSILTPVASMMPRIVLPPGPIRSRILSVGICRVWICGANFERRLASAVQHRIHLVQQEEPSAASLFEGLAHDLPGDAADLDVHLQRGDALARTGYLEVHIAVVVFRAGDVGQDGVVVAFLHQAHGDAGDRTLQRNAGIHQRKAGAADGGHRRGAVGLQNVGDDAEGVRRLVLAGQHGGDGALGQCAVANLAPAYAGHAAGFAD